MASAGQQLCPICEERAAAIGYWCEICDRLALQRGMTETERRYLEKRRRFTDWLLERETAA